MLARRSNTPTGAPAQERERILAGEYNREGQDEMKTPPESADSRGRSWQRIRVMLVLLLLVLLVPTVIVQTIDLLDRYQSRRAGELQANLELARSVAKTFESFVQDVIHQELAIGLAMTSSRPMLPIDITRLLEKSQEGYGAVRDFSWVSPDGLFLYSSNPAMVGSNNRDRAYFRDIVGGREWTVGELVKARTTGQPVFGISRGIRDERGVLLGVVVATIVPEQLDAVLSVERGKGGGLALVDNKGMLVYGYPRIDATWEERDWLRQYPQYVEVFKGQEVTAEVYAGYEGKSRLIGFTPVASIGWAATAGRSEEAAMAEITATLLPEALIFLLVALGAFGAALYLSRFISLPVKRLRDHAAAIGQGEVRQPAIGRGPAELRELAEAFNGMARELRSREASLLEQREWLRVTLTSIGDAVIATDDAGNITFLNPVASALTGWPSEEALGQPIRSVFRIMNEQTGLQAEDIVTRVIGERCVVNLANHTVLVARDGREIPIEDSAAPIADAAGNVIGVVLVFHDVTEKRRAQAALRESHRQNDLLASYIRLSSQPFGAGYPDGRLALVNKAFERLTGFTFDELREPGRMQALTPPEWRELERRMLAEVRRTGLPARYEKEYVRKDGARVPVELLVQLTADADGNPMVFSFITDITERVRAQDELRRSHDELELRVRERTAELTDANKLLGEKAALLDLAHDAILVRSMDEKIVFWNRGAEETYGWKEGEALGRKVHELLKSRFPIPWEELRSILLEKEKWEGELVHTTREGKLAVVASRWAVQKDASGKTLGYLEINRDITGRKRAEDELKAYARQLELMNQELQEFAFVASHDLQEPLRKIKTFGDMLASRCAAGLDAAGQGYLQRMLDSADRLRRLLDDLLQYSRVTARPEPFKEIQLDKVAREAANIFELREGGMIEVERMPAIEADGSQMVRLFQNLIGNALKFCGASSARIRISAREDDRGGCEILVKDNGIGFDQRFAERIFKPFQRLHGRNEYEGTGMGLAICRKIVERHGGSIRVESEPGKGSTFIIRLPVKQDGTEGGPWQ